jgi:ribonuclease Y
MLVPALIAGVVGLVAALALVAARNKRDAQESLDLARAEASAMVRAAEIEIGRERRSLERAAREEGLEKRAAVEEEITAARAAMEKREEAHIVEAAELDARSAELDDRKQEYDERQNRIRSLKDRAAGLRRDTEARYQRAREELETRSGRDADEITEVMSQRWLEDAQASAAARVRAAEQAASDPVHDESAKRLLQISTWRYENHFLTERSISRLPLNDKVAELLVAEDGRVHRVLEQVSNVQLQISDEGDHVRLEGLDGVGREIARRALKRLARKRGAFETCQKDPEAWVTDIREKLHREIVSLGKRAFSVLKIKRAHPEIVDLVGRLNYRTSYTQNQWLHAMEAAFLASMMAEELGLDRKLMRRATLLHDIGKSLTHEIDGSHAVIGADIARRLGEDELVANAIGSHHNDEPANSVYAHLVAAADAMSGARPGARREMSDSYGNRVEELERIGRRIRGVDRAFAVHGGRELRVYVDDQKLTDLDCVELSTSIAEQVSEEMTFPGQIKVTVIRSYEAVTTAS